MRQYSVLNRGVAESISTQKKLKEPEMSFQEEQVYKVKQKLYETKKKLQKQTKIMVIDLNQQWKRVFKQHLLVDAKTVLEAVSIAEQYGLSYNDNQKGIIAQIIGQDITIPYDQTNRGIWHIEQLSIERIQLKRIVSIILWSIQKLLSQNVYGMTIQHIGDTLRINLIFDVFLNGNLETRYSQIEKYLSRALLLLCQFSEFCRYHTNQIGEDELRSRLETEMSMIDKITYTASRTRMFESRLLAVDLSCDGSGIFSHGSECSKDLTNFGLQLSAVFKMHYESMVVSGGDYGYQMRQTSTDSFCFDDQESLSRVFEFAFTYDKNVVQKFTERELRDLLQEAEFSFPLLSETHGANKAEKIWNSYLDFHSVLRFKEYLSFLKDKQDHYEQELGNLYSYVCSQQFIFHLSCASRTRIDEVGIMEEFVLDQFNAQLVTLKVSLQSYLSTYATICELVSHGCQPLASYFTKLCKESTYEKILYVTAKGDSGKSLLRTALCEFLPGLYGAEDKNLLDSTVGRIPDIDKRRFLSCDEGLHSAGQCIVDSFYRIGEQSSQIYQLSSAQRKDMSTFYFITQTDESIHDIQSLANAHYKNCKSSTIENDDLVQQLERRITFLNLSGKYVYDASYSQFFELSKLLKQHAESIFASIIFLKFHNFYTGSKLDWLLSKEHRNYITKLSYMPLISNSLEQGIEESFGPSIITVKDDTYADLFQSLRNYQRRMPWDELNRANPTEDIQYFITPDPSMTQTQATSRDDFDHMEDPPEISETHSEPNHHPLID